MILEEVIEPSQQNSIKIRFLESERQQLTDEVRNLQQSLYLNKLSLKQISSLLSSKYSQEQATSVFNKSLDRLFQENKLLKSCNQNLQKSIQTLKCEILIGSQVTSELEQQYLAIIRNYDEKILEFRRTIQDKQLVIQEKQIMKKDPFNLKFGGIFPRHDLVRMQIQVEQCLGISKALASENSKLKNQYQKTSKQLIQKRAELQRILQLVKCTNTYIAFKDCMQRDSQKRSVSNELKTTTLKLKNTPDRTIKQNKRKPVLERQSSECACSTLRRLLFREKKNTEVLTRQISDLATKNKQLLNSNKLLTESNVNYQVKRNQIKSELLFFKSRYTQLAQIFTYRQSNTKRFSLQKSKNNKASILEEYKKNSLQQKAVKFPKSQIKLFMSQYSKVWTNSIIRNSKYNSSKRSVSCMGDYIFVEKKDVPKKIKKLQRESKLKPIQESINDPFFLDYSVIKPDDFGDISACFKKAKKKDYLSQKNKQNIMVF